MDAEMLNRGTVDRPLPSPSLSQMFTLKKGRGGSILFMQLNGTIAFQKPKIGKGITNKNSKYFSL